MVGSFSYAVRAILPLFVVMGIGCPVSLLANVVEVSACGLLDQPNTTYRLISDIAGVTGECMVITADRVTFDGQGHSISGTGPIGAGVVVSGANRVAVTNLIVHDFDNGIQFLGATGGTVRQTTVDRTSKGISFINSTSMLAESNDLTESFRAILAYDSTDVTVQHNNIWNPSYGVQLEYSYDSLVESNYMEAARKYAVYLEGGGYNKVLRNYAYGNRDGLYNVLSRNNDYTGNVIVDSSRYGFYIAGDSSDDVTLADGVFINSAVGHYEFDFYVGHGDIEGLRIIDTLIGQHFITEPIAFSYEDSRYGSVEFLEPVSGFGTSLSELIHFDLNLLSISPFSPEYDVPSMATLYHIPRMAHPTILHDDQPCEGCAPLTLLVGDEVSFEATGAGEFSIGTVE
jgi:nitrous oxidase accessory protein NosD